MKKIILLITALIFLTGCGNLSPRDNLSPQLQQKLDKIEGNQNLLENNQNAIKLELGRLQNALEIQGNQNETQQGWLNINGDGITVGVISLFIIFALLFYIFQLNKYKKITNVLTNEIRSFKNENLNERIMTSVWNTKLEKTIFFLIK